MIVKTQAIVIRIIPFSETSRIVTWLTEDYGKILTIIKGAQRRKSRFLGQFDLFYTCELLFYLRTFQGLHIINECSPLKFREQFRTRWQSTACASYVSDLVFRICPIHAPHGQLYQWLESALDFFASKSRIRVCLPWYELKLMKVLGLSPQFNVCLKCRQPLSENFEHHMFSYRQGGIYCCNCGIKPDHDTIKMAPDILGLLRFWQASKTWQSAWRSRCTTGQIEQIEKILGLLLQFHLGINTSSRTIALDVLHSE